MASDSSLYQKFEVRRTDGTDAPGGKHHGCEYFVLDVTHDPAAKAALRAYVGACRKDRSELAGSIEEKWLLLEKEAQDGS